MAKKTRKRFINSNFSFEESDAVVIPAAYEKTVCYMRGTAKGPSAIINASLQLEDFDVELNCEISHNVRIHTAKETKKLDSIGKKVAECLAKGKLPVLLGGEHTVSAAAVKEAVKKYPKLSVLQIDAHADLRDEFMGKRQSHACVMRRIREMTKRAVSVGIRDMSIEESEYIKREGIASSIHGIGFDADRIAAQLSDYVYITIDLDGFDPSEIPAVGTPQPGGLHWATVLKLLRKIAEKKNIVGFDVVELSPIKGQIASEFTAAKLVYKLIGYSLLEK